MRRFFLVMACRGRREFVNRRERANSGFARLGGSPSRCYCPGALKSGHFLTAASCQSGLMQCSKTRRYSITSSARCCRNQGTRRACTHKSTTLIDVRGLNPRLQWVMGIELISVRGGRVSGTWLAIQART
jgi:hypothetical protein